VVQKISEIKILIVATYKGLKEKPTKFQKKQQDCNYRKHTMMGQKYFKGREEYTKYNTINNNSKNFRGQDCC